MEIFYKSALAICLATSLVACGGGDSDTSTTDNTAKQKITGKAATGAALSGTVQAINAKGETSEAVTVSADGSYTVTINKNPPYMIKAVSNNLTTSNGKPLELFSYSETGNVANITTLTTQALFSASNKGNLKTIFDSWKTNFNALSGNKVNEAAKKVLVNLKAQFDAAGVKNNPNIFTTDFKTDGTGLDKVLDNFKLDYNCVSVNSCTFNYRVAGQPYSWNYNASTNTINFDAGQTAASGNAKLTIQGESITNGVKFNIPKTVLNNIQKPKSQAEFCGTAVTNKANLPKGFTQTSCTFDGSMGRIQGKVTITKAGITVNSVYDYTYSYS